MGSRDVAAVLGGRKVLGKKVSGAMDLARLVKAGHAGGVFSGEGARLAGGRWNHRGTTVVYASDSLALAALELFVHHGKARSALSFVFFRIEIPDNVRVESISVDGLSAHWREQPPPAAAKDPRATWGTAGETR